MGEENRHVPWLVGLYVVTLVLYVAVLILSTLSNIGSTELFINELGSTSNYNYFIEITPASWTFSIWFFIYTWQAIWLVYGFTLICRRGKTGYLYVNPRVISAGVLTGFCFSCVALIVWLFVWDRRIIEAAFSALVLAVVSSHVALFYGHRQLQRIKQDLVDQGQTKDLWMTRIFVLNGLAFYNTWISIATCLNFAHVLAYSGENPLPQKAASTAAIALLTIIVMTWFILKNFVCEKYLRFTYSPFIVLPVGLAGSIYKNWDRNNGNSVFTAMLLAVVAIMFIFSLTHTVIRQVRDNKKRQLLVEDQESVSVKEDSL